MATAERPSIADCPVCFERYKIPKIVSCGHSFCLNPCIYSLMESHSPNCRLCRTPIQKPLSGKVEDLPTNFALQWMIEAYAANLEACSSVPKSNDTNRIKRNSCVEHEGDFVAYCKVCSELLCQKCLNESHDQDHDTTEVQEAVDSYCSMLVPLSQDLMDLNKKSDDILNSLIGAKQRCKIEAISVRARIDEAAESVIQQVKERTTELHLEVDEKEDTLVKGLGDLIAKGAEVSLSSECTHGMCDKLKTELMQLDFKSESALDSISKKTATLLKEMSDIEMEAMKYFESIVFKPDKPRTRILLGELINCLEEKEFRLSLTKLEDLSCYVPDFYKYIGCTLFSANAMIFLYQHANRYNNINLRIHHRTGKSEQKLHDVNVVGKISNMSLIRISKLTKFLIVTNNKTLLEVTLNHSDKRVRVVGSITLSNVPLCHISAVSWDEVGENCYALLSDGETIKMFSFSPEKKEMFLVKLEEKVECSNSRGFHVSSFGMAICEEEKRHVRFYETTKSSGTTRTVQVPSIMTEGRPVYVVSSKKDKKWCILWTQSSSPILSCVYQYSASFDEECVLLEVPHYKLESFCFLDEKYMATEERDYNNVNVSIYYVQRSVISPNE